MILDWSAELGYIGLRPLVRSWGADGAAATTPTQRGNIDYDQIRAPARHGIGSQIQMFSGGPSAAGQVAVFDATGNLVPSSGGAGGGVSSVGLSMPGEFSVSGSPVTSSGTLAVSKANQSANEVYAGPTSGGAGAPAFRSLDSADLPVATTSQLGAVQPDGTTVTISGGVISAAASSEGPFTAPPAAANWIQQNFSAQTSLTDFTSPVHGVRIAEAVHSYGNTNLARYALRAIVSSHWSIKARLRRHNITTSFMAWGLVVRDSASSKSVVFGFDFEAGGLGGVKMTNDTTYNGALNLGGNQLPYQMNIWIRLDYDGTNCTMRISADGVYWSQVIQYASSALWGFLTNAATHYGFGYNANNSGNGGVNQEVDLLSWTESALP
jgi:hypothetical protein